jgi:GT2 family glycosyltransferase
VLVMSTDPFRKDKAEHGLHLAKDLMPSVSVVLVDWNSVGYLERCLGCLDRQTYQPSKVIVVDNGGATKGLDGIKSRYPWITCLHPGNNLGFAAANNLGARAAGESKWLALLNPDAFAEPDWLANLVKATLENPQFSFFGSRMLKASDPETVDGIGDVYHTSGLVWREAHGRSARDGDLVPREIFSPCAAASLYRLDAFWEVGGFDESYFCYSEDVDLGFRLRLAGYRCLYVPQAVVHHVGSAVTGRRSDFSVYFGHRNLVWTYVKNMPAPLFFLYLPQHLVLNIFTLIWFSLRGQSSAILRSKRHALKGLLRAWEDRRIIQRNRKIGSLRLLAVMAKGMAPLKRFLRAGGTV